MISLQLTEQQYLDRLNALRDKGCDVHLDNANAGSVSKLGIVVAYTYENGKLCASFTKKPELLTHAYCERKLLAWLS